MTRIVDIHTFFGRLPDRDWELSLETLRRELSDHGVGDALTRSLMGATYFDEEGNRATLEACGQAGGIRLHPVGTIQLAAHARPERVVDECLDNGCRAIIVAARSDRDPGVESLPFRQVMARLSGQGVPVLMTADGWGDPSQIAEATAPYDVPVVLLGAHYSHLAEFAAVLRRHSHVYTDTHRMASPGDYELLISEVGAGRLLHGSGAPIRPMQCPLNSVLCADISDDAKRAILGGNAVRLFRLPSDASDRSTALPKPKLAKGLIDVHGHTGKLSFPIPHDDRKVSEMVTRYEIEAAIVSSIRAIASDLTEGNDEEARSLALYDNLRGYVVVNPHHLASSAAEMDRHYKNPRFIGAKIHCEYSRCHTARPEMAALFREIARRGKPVKIHNAGPGWGQALVDACRRDPELRVIVAHGGEGQPSIEGARAVAETEGIYLEFCSTFPELSVLREAVRIAGPDRVMFGTDIPLINAAWIFGMYYDAGLLTRENTAKMTKTTRQLFGL